MKAERVKSKKTGRTGWRYRFMDPYTGRRIKRHFWYSEEMLAQKALHEFLEDRQKLADNLPVSNGRRMPYLALVTKFLDEAPISSKERRDDLKRMLERNPLKLKLSAELFDRGRLTSACRKLNEGGDMRCGFRSVQAPLKQLTAWATSAQLFTHDPLRDWKRLPWSKRGKGARALGVDDLRLILEALAELDEVFRRKNGSLVPVLALLVTGNRSGAVFGSRIADLKEDRISLPEGNGKKRNGSATMPAAFIQIIRKHLEMRGAEKDDAPLFVSYRGGAIDRVNLLQDFKRAVFLAAVRCNSVWLKAEFAEVEPVAVAHRLFTGQLRGHDGAPPRSAVKQKARDKQNQLVNVVAVEIESKRFARWCRQKTLKSFRKTGISVGRGNWSSLMPCVCR